MLTFSIPDPKVWRPDPRAIRGATVGDPPLFRHQQAALRGRNLENIAYFARSEIDAIDHLSKFPGEKQTHPAATVAIAGPAETSAFPLNVYRLKGGRLRALLHPTALENARRGPG